MCTKTCIDSTPQSLITNPVVTELCLPLCQTEKCVLYFREDEQQHFSEHQFNTYRLRIDYIWICNVTLIRNWN